MPWTLAQLAPLLGAEVAGEPGFVVHRPAPAGSGDPEALAFCESPRYLEAARKSGVGAVILPIGCAIEGKPSLRAEQPRAAFERFLDLCRRPLPLAAGVHPTAVIDPDATIDDTAAVGAYAVIERGAVIAAGAKIYPHCYVGEGCVVGSGTVLYPHVVLYQDVRLGRRCVVHSHAVLGTDGFGFTADGGTWRKVAQVGGVSVGDDVEIGAGTTVDRATSGATTIAEGSKVDNLVQVAHNVGIGAHTLICAQSGVAGSSVLGRHVVLGGQAGVGDHVTLADEVNLAAQAGTARSLLNPGAYYGTPALPLPDGLRVAALLAQLPRLHQRIQELERALAGRDGEPA